MYSKLQSISKLLITLGIVIIIGIIGFISLCGVYYIITTITPDNKPVQSTPIVTTETITPTKVYPTLSKLEWYKTRYGTVNIPTRIEYWDYTKNIINRNHLYTLTKSIFLKLPHIKSSNNLINLVVETAEAETLRGILCYNRYSTATGIFQILPSTALDTNKFLSKYYTDVYIAINQFYNSKYSIEWNLKYNLSYSIAMCVTYYWRMNPNLWNNINTVEERANVWKHSYNTNACRYGNVNKYINNIKYLEGK